MPYLVDPTIWSYIAAAALADNVPAEAICAIIQTESAWQPNAIGDAGHSFGLMQLNDAGAGENYTPAELLDPKANIALGSEYLALCYQATGQWEDAFSAYNQGVSGWQKNGAAANASYVAVASAHYELYRAIGIRPRREGEILCAYDPRG